MRVYLAGPIHSPVGVEKDVLKERFHTLAEWLRKHVPEWEVVNPLDCAPGCEDLDTPCQDRSGLPSGEGHSWECWMKGDLRHMLTCDAIALMPYWEASNGASLEAEIAERLHMPRFKAWPAGGEHANGALGWEVVKE